MMSSGGSSTRRCAGLFKHAWGCSLGCSYRGSAALPEGADPFSASPGCLKTLSPYWKGLTGLRAPPWLFYSVAMVTAYPDCLTPEMTLGPQTASDGCFGLPSASLMSNISLGHTEQNLWIFRMFLCDPSVYKMTNGIAVAPSVAGCCIFFVPAFTGPNISSLVLSLNIQGPK